jgi:hypothetical protein
VCHEFVWEYHRNLVLSQKGLLNLWMAVIGRRTVGSNFGCSDEEADCFRPVVPGEEEGVIDRVVFGSGRN